MGTPSGRYVAAHFLMPRCLAQHGTAVLDAIERGDADFFIPVWMEAGFRFTPRMIPFRQGDVRAALLSLPGPREPLEAFFCAFVARDGVPGVRYFTWELAALDGALRAPAATVMGSWEGSVHRNFGSGPPFTADAAVDVPAFQAAVLALATR